MSLEDLKRKAEEEEAEQPETDEVDSEAESDETEGQETDEQTEGEEEGEGQEAAPSEDFELTLDGEPEPGQQQDPEKALIHKLTKERKKRQAAKSEADELRAELDALKAQVAGGQRAPAPTASPQPSQDRPENHYPPVPVLYENGINTPDQYQKAYQEWVAKTREIDRQFSQQSNQRSEYQANLEAKREKLATSAAKFMQENKISSDRVAGAIQKATDEFESAVGIEGAFVELLDAVGEGSERVAYYLGTNDKAMADILAKMQADPTGLRASAAMTRMAGQLKPKHGKRISSAPDPDEPLKGDGSSPSAKKLQDQYDKETDPTKLLALRKQAKEKGVSLK